LNQLGEANYYDVEFKSRLIRNIPVSELIIVREQVHEHETRDERE